MANVVGRSFHNANRRTQVHGKRIKLPLKPY